MVSSPVGPEKIAITMADGALALPTLQQMPNPPPHDARPKQLPSLDHLVPPVPEEADTVSGHDDEYPIKPVHKAESWQIWRAKS